MVIKFAALSCSFIYFYYTEIDFTHLFIDSCEISYLQSTNWALTDQFSSKNKLSNIRLFRWLVLDWFLHFIGWTHMEQRSVPYTTPFPPLIFLLFTTPGTSRSSGLCSPDSQWHWNWASRQLGPCNLNSRPLQSPARLPCSPERKARLGTGLGAHPWKRRWWGSGHPLFPTAVSAWGTGRSYSPGQWSRRRSLHSSGCRLGPECRSWGRWWCVACRG